MPVTPSHPGSAVRGGSHRTGLARSEVLLIGLVCALLIGLLAPVLGSARRETAAAACTANLRELGRTFQLYVEDYGASPDPVEWSRSVRDARALRCPEDPRPFEHLSSYSFRTRIPPDHTEYWKVPRVNPETVLLVCSHHWDAGRPTAGFKLVLRAGGRVERIRAADIREVSLDGSQPTFGRLYPGEAGYDLAR